MKPDRKPGFFAMLWGLLYPFLLYQGITTAISVAVGSVLMAGNLESLTSLPDPEQLLTALQDLIFSNYGIIAGLGALCTLPILIYLYRYDTGKEIRASVHEEWERVPVYHYVSVLIMGAAVCLALNHLMIYSRLTELLQEGYEDTAALLFQGRLILEIAVAGILIPVVEELIFRGLAYRRMRWYIGHVFCRRARQLAAGDLRIHHGRAACVCLRTLPQHPGPHAYPHRREYRVGHHQRNGTAGVCL